MSTKTTDNQHTVQLILGLQIKVYTKVHIKVYTKVQIKVYTKVHNKIGITQLSSEPSVRSLLSRQSNNCFISDKKKIQEIDQFFFFSGSLKSTDLLPLYSSSFITDYSAFNITTLPNCKTVFWMLINEQHRVVYLTTNRQHTN